MRNAIEWLKRLSGLVALAVLAIILAVLFGRAANPSETEPHGGQSTSPLRTLLPVATSPLATPLPTATYAPESIDWRLVPPTATPPGYQPVYTGVPPTATPYPGEIRPSAVFTTPTPLPISKVVDLAQGLPDERKYVFIIRRASGEYEKHLIPIGFSGDEKLLLELGPGDVIVTGYPLKPGPSRIIVINPTTGEEELYPPLTLTTTPTGP